MKSISNSWKSIWVTILVPLIGIIAPSVQADDWKQTDKRPVTVVVKEIAPFVIKEDERLTGFSIDLWEKIAQETEIPFEYVEVETVDEQLDAIGNKDADIAIAAITINSEREETLDFSYPYYESGIQIMTPVGGGQLVTGFLSVLLSRSALSVLGSFVLTMFIISNLIWILERRKNSDEFPDKYLRGVWEAFWLNNDTAYA